MSIWNDDTVVILGKGSTRVFCKKDHNHIYGVNNVYELCPDYRFERIYQLHRLSDVYKNHPSFKDDVNKLDIPVYLQNVVEDIPKSRQYPLDLILKEFKTLYFTNSIAYIIAHIIMENKFKRIALFGVDCVKFHEWEFERPCIEFWLGVAIGRGFRIYVSQGSYLFTPDTGKSLCYGFVG